MAGVDSPGHEEPELGGVDIEDLDAHQEGEEQFVLREQGPVVREQKEWSWREADKMGASKMKDRDRVELASQQHRLYKASLAEHVPSRGARG